MLAPKSVTSLSDSLSIFYLTPADRINLIRAGVSAQDAKKLLARLDIPQNLVLESLKLPTATVNRKAKDDANLSLEDSERIIGVSRLIGQVDAMVRQSGDSSDFDPAHWLSDWLQLPLPALGGARPLDFIDTMEGLGMVSGLLNQMQSGAYV
jgi:putative toxin-antitoxin system antitoxin component (TIGR02293 family)